MNDINITPHFKLSEFLISDTRSSSLNFENVSSFLSSYDDYFANLRSLCNVLEIIRQAYGQPIYITSGYRCLSVNNKFGGVPNSKHLSACACDLKYTSRLAAIILELRQTRSITLSEFIIGKRNRYIHIAI